MMIVQKRGVYLRLFFRTRRKIKIKRKRNDTTREVIFFSFFCFCIGYKVGDLKFSFSFSIYETFKRL